MKEVKYIGKYTIENVLNNNDYIKLAINRINERYADLENYSVENPVIIPSADAKTVNITVDIVKKVVKTK